MTPLKSYSRLHIWLHWLTLIAVAVQIWTYPAISRTHHAAHLGLEIEPFDLVLHKVHAISGGLAFLFACTRLWLRWRKPISPPANLPVWQARAAAMIHFALYAVLLTLPATGFLRMYFLSSAGPVHILLTKALYLLLAIHVAAALWHAIVCRDGVVARMGLRLPFFR